MKCSILRYCFLSVSCVYYTAFIRICKCLCEHTLKDMRNTLDKLLKYCFSGDNSLVILIEKDAAEATSFEVSSNFYFSM